MKTHKQNKNDRDISIIYEENDSININIFNNKILMAIAGSFDSNLKKLVVHKFTLEAIQSR